MQEEGDEGRKVGRKDAKIRFRWNQRQTGGRTNRKLKTGAVQRRLRTKEVKSETQRVRHRE